MIEVTTIRANLLTNTKEIPRPPSSNPCMIEPTGVSIRSGRCLCSAQLGEMK
jgi:hypothetical protein